MMKRSMEWENAGISLLNAMNQLFVVGTFESNVPTIIEWSYDVFMKENRKFRGKYRNESARKPLWDYAKPGRYFITLCTKGRFPWFGNIQNGVMCLSDMGSKIHQYWADIPHHFPHITLDAYIIMPDHMHGILIIGQHMDVAPNMIVERTINGISRLNIDGDDDMDVAPDMIVDHCMDHSSNLGIHVDDIDVVPDMIVGTFDSNVPTPAGDTTSAGATKPTMDKKFMPRRPSSGSLGSVIGQFKSICTKQIWKMGYPHFAWQSRFHDRIIHNDTMLINMRRYIHNNTKQI